MLCPQLCMGIQPGARFSVRSADALPATLYGHFTQAIYRNRPSHRVLIGNEPCYKEPHNDGRGQVRVLETEHWSAVAAQSYSSGPVGCR
jgi:hypothetical protein